MFNSNTNQIKKLIGQQFREPEEEFIKFFASRVYNGVLTPKVKAQFLEITGKALKQFLNDSINDRLKSAIGSDGGSNANQTVENVPEMESAQLEDSDNKVVTTEEEIEGFNIVRAILRKNVPVKRIVNRDTQSYFGILLDDNNRKPLCRLHFNAKQKYLGVFDEAKKETRIPIDAVDDIYQHAEVLIKTLSYYDSDSE